MKKRKNRRYRIVKPSKWKLFVKYFAVALCVVVLLGYVGTEVAVSWYKNEQGYQFDSYVTELGNSVNSGYTEMLGLTEKNIGTYENWQREIRFQMNLKSSISGGKYTAKLYDAETREEIVGNSEEYLPLFLQENRNTEEECSAFYECPVEMVKDMVETYQRYDEAIEKENNSIYRKVQNMLEISNEDSEYINVDLKDVYVKDGMFIPGKVSLYKATSPFDAEIVLEEYDYTPENVEGYRHIVLEGDETKWLIGPFIWTFREQEELEQYLEEIMEYGALLDYSEETYEESGETTNADSMWNYENYGLEYSFFWGNYYFQQTDILLADGTTVKLAVFCKTNLLDDYGTWFLISYVVLLGIALLTAMVLSYYTYMKRWSHYQLDQYRRNTTNAMAHDLKTPLMAISGYAENLRDNVHSEKKDYYAGIILENVQYMNEMVSNILELSKVEDVNWTPQWESVDMKALTEEILKKYEILTADKKMDAFVEGELVLQADKLRITQVLDNLISNAIQYGAKETVISIEMKESGYSIRNVTEKELQVSVDELWKPFVRGDNSRNEQRGTGIGLTIVKNILDVHGFELVLQCEEEFIVTIQV